MEPPNYLIKIANLREPSREVYVFFVEEPGQAEIKELARKHKVDASACVLFKLTGENRARIVANSRWLGWKTELQLKRVPITAAVARIDSGWLSLSFADAAGGFHVGRIEVELEKLDEKLLLKLFKKLSPELPIGPCAHCGQARILSHDLKIALCGGCFAAQLKVLGEKEKAKTARALAKRIAGYKSQGFRYYATIWIHIHGDDFFVVEPFLKRPTQSELRAIAKREKSAVLGDFQVHKVE